MSAIKFGTDGWRALMDKDFTFDNVERVAQAFCDYLKDDFNKKGIARSPKVTVGYDYRKNSENFAKSVAEVLVGNGVEVLLSDSACPTPAVSFAIVDGRQDAGIMITASHNPPGYNGIKIKTDFGGSADKNVTDGVEVLIGKTPVQKNISPAGNLRIEDLNIGYLNFMKRYLRIDLIKQSSFRVLVDPMHGVGNRHVENILSGGKIKVETIRSDRDVTFGGVNPEPIPQNLGASIEMMKKGGYDICIVTDGDADRVGAIRPGGEFVSPGTILSLILLHMAEDLKRTGSVVTTISNTALIYRIARKLGLTVHETPVGFKYVCEIMRRERVLIGGEESGGIGFQDYLYERDGMLTGLLLVEMMAMRNKSFDQLLSQMEAEFGKLHYVRNDVQYPNELKAGLFNKLAKEPPRILEGHRVKSVKRDDGVKITLEDDSWLLFRLSGTEPLLRIYSEATSRPLAESLVKYGKELAFNAAPAS
jgi:phosphomannomutase